MGTSGLDQKRYALWDIGFDRLASITKLYEWTRKQTRGQPLFPFAVGQLYAAELAKEICQFSDLQYTWGQIINKDAALSREIDLILFSGKPYLSWATIGFSLVRSNDVEYTIECKTELSVTEEEFARYKMQIQDLQQWTTKKATHFIFAACCYLKGNTYERWANELRQDGWNDVFLLYDGVNGDKERRKDWYRLMETFAPRL